MPDSVMPEMENGLTYRKYLYLKKHIDNKRAY